MGIKKTDALLFHTAQTQTLVEMTQNLTKKDLIIQKLKIFSVTCSEISLLAHYFHSWYPATRSNGWVSIACNCCVYMVLKIHEITSIASSAFIGGISTIPAWLMVFAGSRGCCKTITHVSRFAFYFLVFFSESRSIKILMNSLMQNDLSNTQNRVGFQHSISRLRDTLLAGLILPVGKGSGHSQRILMWGSFWGKFQFILWIRNESAVVTVKKTWVFWKSLGKTVTRH